MSKNSKINPEVKTEKKDKGTFEKILGTGLAIAGAIFTISKGLNKSDGQNKA